MTTKLRVMDLKPGKVVETTFWPNPESASKYRWRATHIDGKKAPKVVLCDDERIRAGIPCQVRIVAVRKPERDDRGMIEVSFVRLQEFRLEGVWVDPIVSKKLQVCLECDLNILLDGPQGCGKTVLARQIAKALGMEFVFFNCSAVVEATDFLATLQVRASEAGSPVTDFVKTDLLVALEEAATLPARRYLVFLDELNRCQESARNVLMPALDTTRRIFNPVSNSFLTIPGNVQFIAAVNRGNEFTATFGIDAAQLDRFAPIQMDYMPEEEELRLLMERHPELGRKLVQRVVGIAKDVRDSPELGRGLSVRATDEACTYLKHPLFEDMQDAMLDEVLKSSFCGRFGGRWDDATTDAGAVWAIVSKHLRMGKVEEAKGRRSA